MSLLENGPPVIAALHLPDFVISRHRPMGWFEEYALANARVFAEAGVPWIKLQDQTRTSGPAAPETLAMMAALGRLIRAEFQQIGLGIIVDAHDPTAALSIAHASGAGFVRLKVFVGGAMTAEGPRYGLSAATVAYRAALIRPDIAILADIHDRTARPLSDETQSFAAKWAVEAGADGLIVTGSHFSDTLSRIATVREALPSQPILIGGGVSEANVVAALAASDGVIVSSALMRRDTADDDLVQWDTERCLRFMDAVRAA